MTMNSIFRQDNPLVMLVVEEKSAVTNCHHVPAAKPPIFPVVPPAQQLGGVPGSRHPTAMSKPLLNYKPSPPSRRQSPPVERDNTFEGDSSFMTHSKQATQALKASLAATPQLNVDEALSDAVANLQQALESSHTQPSTSSYSAESTNDDESHGLSSLPLPPSSLVLRLLKRAK
ncbi:MAG: hypothetical protein Q9198_006484, partial [Flavoplaca austrocitrina]